MDESAILIIGSGGQLGRALRANYPSARAVDQDTLNISDAGQVNNYDWTNIKTIINAAAYTDVDGAETNEGRLAAWKANATAPANLARIAQQKDITVVHISTDYVFDGTQEPHTETEDFSPLSVYGASKAAGDIAISTNTKHYILRTSWVIGDGKNFVRTMLDLGKKGINPSVVNDQIGRLTFTSTLVGAIHHLLSTSSPFGTYNVSNEGESSSWAEIARTIFKEASLSSYVTDVSTKQYYEGKTNIAPRPLKSTLDLAKIKSTGFTPLSWRDDLHNYIAKEMAQ